MRYALMLSVVATLALPLLSTAIPPQLTAAVSPAFEIEVSVQPSAADRYQLLKRATPETYTCEARVNAAGERYGFTVVNLVAVPGQTETATRKFGDDYKVTFTVQIRAASPKAQTTVEVSRGDRVLTRQKSTVSLQLPARGIAPAQ